MNPYFDVTFALAFRAVLSSIFSGSVKHGLPLPLINQPLPQVPRPSATNIHQIINFRTGSWNARGPTCKQFAQVAAIMEKQKDEGDEDKVRGGGAEEGCLVSSHKGRSAPLRTQRNQPATLTRNIHKPAPARAWNGERIEAVRGQGGYYRTPTVCRTSGS